MKRDRRKRAGRWIVIISAVLLFAAALFISPEFSQFREQVAVARSEALSADPGLSRSEQPYFGYYAAIRVLKAAVFCGVAGVLLWIVIKKDDRYPRFTKN